MRTESTRSHPLTFPPLQTLMERSGPLIPEVTVHTAHSTWNKPEGLWPFLRADWQPWALCGRGLCQPSLQFRCNVLLSWLTICRACRCVSVWSLINVLTTKPGESCKTGLSDNVSLLPPFQVQDFWLLKQGQLCCWFAFTKTICMSQIYFA